jgi:hypothetical protein
MLHANCSENRADRRAGYAVEGDGCSEATSYEGLLGEDGTS